MNQLQQNYTWKRRIEGPFDGDVPTLSGTRRLFQLGSFVIRLLNFLVEIFNDAN